MSWLEYKYWDDLYRAWGYNKKADTAPEVTPEPDLDLPDEPVFRWIRDGQSWWTSETIKPIRTRTQRSPAVNPKVKSKLRAVVKRRKLCLR